MDWKKRTLSLMLAVAMLISNCPVAAFAAENAEIPFEEEWTGPVKTDNRQNTP